MSLKMHEDCHITKKSKIVKKRKDMNALNNIFVIFEEL